MRELTSERSQTLLDQRKERLRALRSERSLEDGGAREHQAGSPAQGGA